MVELEQMELVLQQRVQVGIDRLELVLLWQVQRELVLPLQGWQELVLLLQA